MHILLNMIESETTPKLVLQDSRYLLVYDGLAHFWTVLVRSYKDNWSHFLLLDIVGVQDGLVKPVTQDGEALISGQKVKKFAHVENNYAYRVDVEAERLK